MPVVDVACLCAAWCRTCDGYRPVLQVVAAEFAQAGHDWRWHWIDIEDEAELLGEVDVETFPTLVVAASGALRFAGPLTPQPDTLRRLLRSLAEGADAPAAAGVDEAMRDFARRLPGRSPDLS